jgi:hypothetical protein
VRILFDLSTPGYLRFFDATFDELGRRGHEVAISFTSLQVHPGARESLQNLEHPPRDLGLSTRRTDELAVLARGLRAAIDYVRYLDPAYAEADFLRNRARERALRYGPFSRPFASLRRLRPGQVAVLMRALEAAERAVPSSAEVERFVRAANPDLVLVSPLLVGGSPQTDLVKSARALGIPNGVCVASWDNLTNKGHMRIVPDRVVVWNHDQVREAVELHGVPEDRVQVTGAQPYDRWFGREPSTTREAFCAKVGLPADRPFVLFCASLSNIGEGVEQAFVARWREAIRARHGDGVSVLVRPHPERLGHWDGLFEDDPTAAVWPTSMHNLLAEETRDGFFDSLFHSAAIVGTNTSAMIEAAIAGRPVLTVRASEFEQSQSGTLHFQYLRPEHGGFVEEAWSLEQHLDQLSAAVEDPSRHREANARFVARFIRPHGMDRPCTPILVAAIEEMDGSPAPRPEPPAGRSLAALALRGLARAVALRERVREPEAAKDTARLVARPLRRLAKRAPRHSRLSVSSRVAARRIEQLGRSRRDRLRAARVDRTAERKAVAARGGHMLDPDRVG